MTSTLKGKSWPGYSLSTLKTLAIGPKSQNHDQMIASGFCDWAIHDKSREFGESNISCDTCRNPTGHNKRNLGWEYENVLRWGPKLQTHHLFFWLSLPLLTTLLRICWCFCTAADASDATVYSLKLCCDSCFTNWINTIHKHFISKLESLKAAQTKYLHNLRYPASILQPFKMNESAFCLMGVCWTITKHAGNGPLLMKNY